MWCFGFFLWLCPSFMSYFRYFLNATRSKKLVIEFKDLAFLFTRSLLLCEAWIFIEMKFFFVICWFWKLYTFCDNVMSYMAAFMLLPYPLSSFLTILANSLNFKGLWSNILILFLRFAYFIVKKSIRYNTWKI